MLGNTAANGTFIVANVTTNTFELTGSTGNGTYTAATGWFSARLAANLLGAQDGVPVLGNDHTRRWLGTILTTGTTTTEDSGVNRFVWNLYNRVLRRGSVEDFGSHSIALQAPREYGGGTTMRINFVVGTVLDSSVQDLCVPINYAGPISSVNCSMAGVLNSVNFANSGVNGQLYLVLFGGTTLETGYRAVTADVWTASPGKNFFTIMEREDSGNTAVIGAISYHRAALFT